MHEIFVQIIFMHFIKYFSNLGVQKRSELNVNPSPELELEPEQPGAL